MAVDPSSPRAVHHEIVVVRHGETEWSATGRHTSRTDLPLTERGRERARALAGKLAGRRFSLVLCSPLRRARETCELAGFGDVAELYDDLHEWDYGEYEGLTTPQIRERDPYWSLWRDGCPGGESPARVGARADRVLARLRADGGDALAFAHGHILRVVTARWLGMEVAAGARFALDAGSLGVLGYEHDTQVLSRWNT
jgi:broad specificity phosphatase PhoE